MSTIMVDDDVKYVWTERDPNFVPPTIAESLAQGFEPQVCFYVLGERPVAVWPDWDYAEDWSVHPKREVHPFVPLVHGKEITGPEFRARVKRIHGLEES